jgi:hypothetical protein
MPNWSWSIIFALALASAGALYIRFRWRRSPQAYRAMIALAVCYFVAGSLTGACVLHLASRGSPAPVASAEHATSAEPTPLAAIPPTPPLPYDVAHVVLPNPKLTPGDTFPGVTAADVCTPGWASEHRHVTEEMRDRVYAEYGRTRGPDCCEVDHLIPLELGGSNDFKNLWPQPDEPRPGWGDKDQLENELHAEVCAGKMALADAQHCIASNWVQCWERYVERGHGIAAASAWP